MTWPGWLYTAGEDPPLDRLRAAAQLVGNHGAVTRFAARGCGREGRRPVSAPLSDPSATPGEEHIERRRRRWGLHGCLRVAPSVFRRRPCRFPATVLWPCHEQPVKR